MYTPIDHPLRGILHGEVHARPFLPINPPERVSHIAMLSGEGGEKADREHLSKLCYLFGVPAPHDSSYFYYDFGPFRLKWERHTEFCTYTFFRQGAFETSFEDPAINNVPEDWLNGIPGERLVAVHVAVNAEESPERNVEDISLLIGSDNLVASFVSAGARVWTDFHLHGNGFGRILVCDRGLAPKQVGRLVQRLLEIETYRMMALLAFPLARQCAPKVTQFDRELADIIERMEGISTIDDKRDLLLQLTGLAARAERLAAGTSYRFSAALAYHALVNNRIEDLREERLEGFQTIGEFMERRLAPAIRTCESAANRQAVLAERVVRSSNLLRTSVDIDMEEQNRGLLSSMNRRAKQQLRLQQTVEGLSVAAISYYVVSLVGYAAKAAHEAGMPVDVDVARGLSIPVVIFLVWLGVRQVHRSLGKDLDKDSTE